MDNTGKYIYKVSELAAGIRTVLEDSFSKIWVEGEISNFKCPSSGHFYFTLKDDKSELKCAFFKGHNLKLKFKVKDGMQVLCFGNISVYEKRGEHQLNVITMEPKGIGSLQLAFEALKKKLFKEGLFDAKYKKPIPLIPNRIGIVTSPTGAAIRDILNVLKRRFPNIGVIINPVKVQGEGSEKEIAQAINDFNKLNNVDVIIVGRGGGSIEDLWAFNEEIAARSIFSSKIPVISAVGHEIDWTISDFVADRRAATPSVAGEIVIPEKNKIKDRLDVIEEKLKSFPLDIVKQYIQYVDDMEEGLGLRFKHYIELKDNNFKHISEKLEILGPLNILNRGYSITFKLPEKNIIKSQKEIKKGDLIETKLFKGSFRSKV